MENETTEVANITNVGFQTGEKLANLIREARFTVYPSEWYENCPFSVMESQMYGTPVIGANIGGIPELIQDGQTGELFESGDIAQLKEKIAALWNDEQKQQMYAQNCWNVKFPMINDYYESLMGLYSDSL